MSVNKVVKLEFDLAHKECAVCGQVKPISSFNLSGDSKTAIMLGKLPDRRSACKICTRAAWKKSHDHMKANNPKEHAKELEYKRDYHRSTKNYNAYYKRTYGITFAEVEAMYKEQSGCCANDGCRKQIFLSSDKKWDALRACVDHDHATGDVRGLLCRPCNAILGTLESQAVLVDGLMKYKSKHTKNS